MLQSIKTNLERMYWFVFASPWRQPSRRLDGGDDCCRCHTHVSPPIDSDGDYTFTPVTCEYCKNQQQLAQS